MTSSKELRALADGIHAQVEDGCGYSPVQLQEVVAVLDVLAGDVEALEARALPPRRESMAARAAARDAGVLVDLNAHRPAPGRLFRSRFPEGSA